VPEGTREELGTRPVGTGSVISKTTNYSKKGEGVKGGKTFEGPQPMGERVLPKMKEEKCREVFLQKSRNAEGGDLLEALFAWEVRRKGGDPNQPRPSNMGGRSGGKRRKSGGRE